MIDHASRTAKPMRFVVMGVSAAGKTTFGRALSEQLGIAFLDADALHPPANVAKMGRGEPLDDADRAPWLDAVADAIAAFRAQNESAVVACSALKRRYRNRLRQADPDLCFLYLAAPRDVLVARLARRGDHFMPPTLLDSQLATLEAPAPDEAAVTLDATLPLSSLIAVVLDALPALSHDAGTSDTG